MRENLKKYIPKRKYNFKPLLLIIIAGLIALYYVITANSWLVDSVSFQAVKSKDAVIYYERDITAYNVGIEWQTDDSPCIGATGQNLCEALARGEKVVAANFVPLGTILRIKGYGDYIVLDRMNKRYPQRVDIAFPADQLDEARAFGIQQLNVAIVD